MLAAPPGLMVTDHRCNVNRAIITILRNETMQSIPHSLTHCMHMIAHNVHYLCNFYSIEQETHEQCWKVIELTSEVCNWNELLVIVSFNDMILTEWIMIHHVSSSMPAVPPSRPRRDGRGCPTSSRLGSSSTTKTIKTEKRPFRKTHFIALWTSCNGATHDDHVVLRVKTQLTGCHC